MWKRSWRNPSSTPLDFGRMGRNVGKFVPLCRCSLFVRTEVRTFTLALGIRLGSVGTASCVVGRRSWLRKKRNPFCHWKSRVLLLRSRWGRGSLCRFVSFSRCVPRRDRSSLWLRVFGRGVTSLTGCRWIGNGRTRGPRCTFRWAARGWPPCSGWSYRW